MEIILALIVLIIVWCIAFIAGNKHMIKKIKKDGGYFDTEITGAVYPYKHISSWTPPTSSVDTMGTIGSKPKTQTDYQKENEKSQSDFMYNWIQEKSGKK